MSTQFLRWNVPCLRTLLCAGLILPLTAAAQNTAAISQPTAAISLAPQNHAPRVALAKGEPSYENAPANFHAFASVKAGEDSGVESLTLNFSAATTLKKITSKKTDFVIESGGTCQEGKSFAKDDSCTLLVRFNPQGAGNRLGKITVENSISAQPFSIGMGGNGYAPVVSFNPAVITTVPGTYSSNTGLLSGALNLAVDGSDTLYVADTGNNLIRSMNASGAFTTISSGTVSAPLGVIADNFGEVYFTEPAQNALFEIYAYGPQFQLNGTTSGTCTVATPCGISAEELFTPGEMATDGYNRIFFVDGYYGAGEFVAMSQTASYAHLDDPFTYQASTPGVIAVDSSDNIYSFWYNGGICSIAAQTFSNASNYYSIYSKVAGGRTCGFAGDGGQAGNAEISKNIGQMVFDLAGNLYFSDTNNQRVRRIDASTGQINTIAGNGTAGYSGDGGPAISATLNAPSGVAVDSQGQVYIISSASTGQVIRKVGPNGVASFNNQPKGTTSAATVVTIANTGNSNLELTNALFAGANPGDFAIDPTTTTCQLTPNSVLDAGSSCKIGFLFTPSASGARTANYLLLGNTVTGSNTIQLVGNPAPGVSLSPSMVAFPSTKAGTTTSAAVTVTNTGTTNLGVSGITFTGANASSFGHSSNCGQAAVTPGGTCTITVTFSPSAAGSYSATMNVTDNAANSPQSVSITGSATAAADVPSAHIIKAPVDRPGAARMNLKAQQ